MNSLVLAVIGVGMMIGGYLLYSRFLANRVYQLSDTYRTPAHTMNDGVDYVPTNKYVLWGHHFTSVAGAAPIVGPAVAVIWGWLPAFLWVTIGTVFIAGMHDFGTLWASQRHKGQSIGTLSGRYIGNRGRNLFLVVIFLLLLMVVAAFAVVISNLLVSTPTAVIPTWGAIIVALFIGQAIYRLKWNLPLVSVVGVVILYALMIIGDRFPVSLPDSVLGLSPNAFWILLLFIYGGVGLGKTHLMHAIGNRLLRDRADAKILYIHAEQFVSDVVKAYQRKTFDEFKAYYRSLDLLLIDDVQFFANKERTQEEFFNAFEALLARQSHIVMTSDTYPKGLVNIHERLVSRFDSGLTVAIEPPELEMRVAILISKAATAGSTMPEEVAFFIAKNVRSNVRELEGALRKVLAFARFNQRDISIATSREALRDLLSIQNRLISVESIQKTVADYYKIKVSDMYSRRRPASIARPRQIAMYLAKELTQKSLPEIGDLFGGRDHTTVLHAVRKIGSERQQLPELNQQLHVLEQTLKG